MIGAYSSEKKRAEGMRVSEYKTAGEERQIVGPFHLFLPVHDAQIEPEDKRTNQNQ